MSVLFAVYGDLYSSLSAIVAQVSQEPSILNKLETTKISELVPSPWKAY